MHPHLRSIFSKGHITPPMESVFNRPVLAIQSQQALGICFFSRKIGQPIDDLLTLFLPGFDVSADDKDLGDPCPFWLKPFIHLRTCPNFSHFQSSMPFVHLLMILKFPAVNPLVLEE